MIKKSSYGSFKGNPDIIGVTSLNQYFPIYTIFDHYMYRHSTDNYGEPLSEEILENSYLYNKPMLENLDRLRYGDGTQYADLFIFLNDIAVSTYIFKYEDVHYPLICTKGYIADADGNILLILCTKDFDVFNEDESLKNDVVILYISTSLITNPIYKNVYKRLQSEYIQECHEKDIEVVYTTSKKIEERVYNNGFEVKFNSLSELDEHLKSGVGENLFYVEQIAQPIIEDEVEILPGLLF